MTKQSPLAEVGPMSRRSRNEALRGVARDLRQFVTRLRQPRVRDRAWRQAASERFQQLRTRVEELRAGGKLPRPVVRLRESLGQYKDTLAAKRPHKKRMREMRASLTQAYEDMVAYLKSRGDGRFAEGLRSIRLPRLGRTLCHIGMGLGCVFLYQFVLNRSQAMLVLGIVFGVFATLEITRRFSSRWNDFLTHKLFGAISRPSELHRVNSATFYLSALLLITYVAPQAAVCVAILVLALGDPFAMIVGFNFGRRPIYQDKTLEGSLGFFGVSFAAALVYLLAATELSFFVCIGYAATVSLVGALTELYSGKLDDNFTIPVVCALFGMLWV